MGVMLRASGGTSQGPHTSNALIVDDNAPLAENLSEILGGLQDYQLEAHAARHGQQALEICRKLGSSLDLAIVDLGLPDGNGLTRLSAIREHCPFTQIVILTGDPSVESAAAAIGQRVFAYVSKPFRPPDLLVTAKRAIDQAHLLRERSTLERELTLSEQRHRELVEAIPAFVLALDSEGRIALWNRHLEAITGFSRDEMLGRDGRHLVGDSRPCKLLTRSGGQRLVQWQVSDQTSGTHTSNGLMYCLGIDVTDEEEMLRRTLRAERLAAAGTLAAGLAHEVRNPLNSASLQLQLLNRRIRRGDTPMESLVSIVDVVHSEIRRLDHMVRDFLAFARPTPLSLTQTDLNQLVTDVVGLIRPVAEASNIELVTDLDDSVGQIAVDAERFRQVLLNLAHNSIEAMQRGGLLRLSTHPAELDQVGIDVIDNGPGFAEDAPVFDAFYTTKETGTGLGLAIVHSIVSEHGGALSTESRPGHTQFSIRIPRKVQHLRDR